MSPSQRMPRRNTRLALNGFSSKVLATVAGALIISSVFGMLALWRTSVSAADVSKQIQIEAPYVKDQAVIRKAVDQEIPEIRKELKEFRKEVNTKQTEQQVMTAEIKTIMQQIQNSLDNQ